MSILWWHVSCSLKPPDGSLHEVYWEDVCCRIQWTLQWGIATQLQELLSLLAKRTRRQCLPLCKDAFIVLPLSKLLTSQLQACHEMLQLNIPTPPRFLAPFDSVFCGCEDWLCTCILDSSLWWVLCSCFCDATFPAPDQKTQKQGFWHGLHSFVRCTYHPLICPYLGGRM